MKIIFLDFDGVINNSKCWSASINAVTNAAPGTVPIPVAPECMERLNRLIAETGAYVVISSSWRKFAHWTSLGPSLANYGFKGTVIGETPDLINDADWLHAWRTREGAPFEYERLERGMEIKEWLYRNPTPEIPGVMNIDGERVTGFVVLDDCNDMTDVKDHFVWTDPDIGLDDPDVERAKFLLEKPCSV